MALNPLFHHEGGCTCGRNKTNALRGIAERHRIESEGDLKTLRVQRKVVKLHPCEKFAIEAYIPANSTICADNESVKLSVIGRK